MEAKELNFQIVIDPGLPAFVQDAVCFETGATKEQALDRGLLTYNHHGPEFGPDDPGALTLFFEDLVSGKALPLTLGMHAVAGIDSFLAAALFTQRDLALHPSIPGLVTAVDLVHRKGWPFYSHMEADLARFFRALENFFPSNISKKDRGERLGSALTWFREYVLEGKLPNLGLPTSLPRILDVGTTGFVLAESPQPTIDVWIELFRQGYLRGLLIGPEDGDFRQVLAAKKSPHVPLDFNMAALHLNELEGLSGGTPGWEVDGQLLKSPPDGTVILVSHLVEVFLRV